MAERLNALASSLKGRAGVLRDVQVQNNQTFFKKRFDPKGASLHFVSLASNKLFSKKSLSRKETLAAQPFGLRFQGLLPLWQMVAGGIGTRWWFRFRVEIPRFRFRLECCRRYQNPVFRLTLFQSVLPNDGSSLFKRPV